MKKLFSVLMLAISMMLMLAFSAFATGGVTGTLDVSTVGIDLAPFYTVGGLILTAGAAVVVFRKIKSLLGW